jgi:hypothetical protein
MAQGLHSQKTWEELAEDPFRGLRAGPVTFSPFLFLPAARARTGGVQTPKNSKIAVLGVHLGLRLSKKKRKAQFKLKN